MRKFIKSLVYEERVTLSNIEIILDEIVNFFGKLYSKFAGVSWRVEGLDWFPISGESATWLDQSFSKKEVCFAVFQLNMEKGPWPKWVHYCSVSRVLECDQRGPYEGVSKVSQ